jgi:hypothetical protein
MIRSRHALGLGLVAGLAGWVGLLAPAPALADSGPMPLVLHAASAPVADLFPGGTGTAQFSVDNPNAAAARLESVSFGSVRSSSPVSCPASLLSTHPVVLPAGDVVAAGASGQPYRVAGAFTLAEAAPDGCQGVTFIVDTTVRANIEGQETTSTVGGTGNTGAGSSGTGNTGAGNTGVGSTGSTGATGQGTGGGTGMLAWTGSPVMAVAIVGALLLLVGIVVRLAATARRRRSRAG